MNETCFASQNLESRSITTAYEFFRSASFPLLENLDLSTVIFVSSNIAESNCLTARRTFRDVNLPRLINLNLDNCAF